MTQVAPVKPVAPRPAPQAPRDPQRESLDQIIRLSIECTAEEQRIEEQHAGALAGANTLYQEKISVGKQQHQKRVANLNATSVRQQESIQTAHDIRRQDADTANETAVRQITRQREESDSALKKQVEQGSWQSESALVAFQMRLDTDETKSKQDLDANLAELVTLEDMAREALVRYRIQPFSVHSPLNDAMKAEVEADPTGLLHRNRDQAKALLGQLQELTRPRAADDTLPFVLVVVIAAIAAGAGWLLTADNPKRLWITGGAAIGGVIVGIVLAMFLRSRKRGKITAQANDVYVPLVQGVLIARHAAKAEFEAADAARERRVKEARRKRDLEVMAARDAGRAAQGKAIEHYKSAIANESDRYKNQVAALDAEQSAGLAALRKTHSETLDKLNHDDTEARQQTLAAQAAALAALEAAYEKDSRALEARWNDGLHAVSQLLAAGSGIDPALVDWNSPAWEHWKSPRDFTGQVRFGDMKVDLAQLTEHVPKRLQLPETFKVPALLAMPAHGSLFLEVDHAGRNAANDVAQLVMARLLTQLPAGRAKFTIFDPVGLGQSFAGFMHLADHDESLVGSRIWTEKEHMEQRLADLTEHMETVIQKYLRNEYATIDEYNAQAGELAEPFRFLVIADFPTGFEAESLRRLSSIAMTGPRCGVYTIILRDVRQPMPQGARIEEILSKSVHLFYKDGHFTWDDAVFKRFPLHVDPPPDEKTLTHLMDLVGKAAKEAKRVEVPFQSIAPPLEEFWSRSSKNDLRVPIGKSGATRLQALRLGVGVAQHTLVAGKTGSGKSNLMHTIVTNMAMWYGPDEVEFYLVDFKKGVEFKAYAASKLPHARAIAVESDREFGLSVLQRVDAELSRRGTMFRDAGAQEIGAFRDRTGQKLPRTVLLIDEFQEFFSEDDKVGQEAAGLLDRLVRQGRAFGVHVVLGSQTIGGNSGLARSTLGQIAVRIALQCSEADSQLILGDNNSAARLLTRPGEAIYNDAGGLVEANSPFQIAFLPDGQREQFLDKIYQLGQTRNLKTPAPIVFEGNSAADIHTNARLIELLERSDYPPTASSIPAYIGEPVAIKDPTSIPFRRQAGANVLLIGQQEESAVAIFSSMATSLAAQQKPGDAIFYLMDGTAADSRYFGLLEQVMATLPHQTKVIPWRDTPAAINEIATLLAERQGDDAHAGPSVYLLLFGLQRYRMLRHQEDDFSFSKSAGEDAPKPDKQLAELLSEGPAVGLHTIIWADAPITLERTLERSSMRQFDHRVLFQMSASDSSNLIDSPVANRLGAHRALLYSEEQGTIEKCRPYQVPDAAWLAFLTDHLKARNAAKEPAA